MVSWVKRCLAPPISEDEEEAQIVSWLNAILLFLLASSAVIVVLFVIFSVYISLIITILSGLYFLGLLFFARRGHVRMVSVLLVLSLLGIVTLSAYASDGIHAGVVTAYFLVLAITALLLGGNAVLICALLGILASWGLFYAGLNATTLIHDLQSSFVKVTVISLVLGVTAAVLRFTIQRLNKALTYARRNECALVESNRELEAEIAERKRAEGALQESEARYRTLFDSAGDAIFIHDLSGRFLEVNRIACERLGYSREELLQMTPMDIDSQEYATLVPERLEQLQQHEHVFFETAHVRQDGTIIPIELSSRIIEYAGAPAVLSVARDVTERKQAEEALHRRLAELTVLRAVAIAGAEATSEDALIGRATEVIGGILYPDNFGVVLVDETAGTLRAHPSYRGVRQEFRELAIPLGQGVTGRVAITGQPWRVPDVTSEPAYLDIEPSMRSELCVPLKVGERVIGVINAESRHLNAFSEDDERLMMTFAGQLATAVEKVRLFEAARLRAQEAETLRQAGAAVAATLQQDEAIERILQELARVVPYDSASVQLLREGYMEIIGGRGWPDPTAVMGLRFPIPGDNPNTVVVRQRQPHILADAPAAHPPFREEPHAHIQSWLGVPLIVHDQVIGMLAIDSAQPNHFTPDHARLVTAFADQVAIAIENARLFREVQELAITDSLTGLYNRRHFFELAKREVGHAQRYARPLSALMLDVDHFKRVNDTYGHLAGDEVLRVVAEHCRENLREVDLLGRYGGDEFAALLPETDRAKAQLVAERLRQGIARATVHTEQSSLTAHVSLGVGFLDESCIDLEDLLRRADRALYAAKRAGGNRVRVWRN